MKIKDELKKKEKDLIWGMTYHLNEFAKDLLKLERLEEELKELKLNSLDIDWIKQMRQINKAHNSFINLITKANKKGKDECTNNSRNS